jgi:hypothetical protein
MRLRLLGLVVASCAAAACTPLKPYEKEFLLHPTMSDEATAPLRADLMSAASGGFEKLGQATPGGGAATSCPTCGG